MKSGLQTLVKWWRSFWIILWIGEKLALIDNDRTQKSTDKIDLELINEKIKVSLHESDITGLTEGKAKTSNYQIFLNCNYGRVLFLSKKETKWLGVSITESLKPQVKEKGKAGISGVE